MYRIRIVTPVEHDAESVFHQFDRKLFDALQPPFPPITILRFEGSEVGDKVQVKMFTGWKQEVWESIITERIIGKMELVFTDEGTALPWFLKQWKHRHRVQRKNKSCVIIDDIELAFPNVLIAALFYPVIYMQFAWRRHIYRKYFAYKR